VKAATNDIVVAKDCPTCTRVAARATLKAGRLFSVCSYCQTDAMRSALKDLTNLTHGICDPCLEREKAAMQKEAA
jgi:hypothetical protein